MTTITSLQSALPHIKPQPVHIKSKYGAEFRRFSITPLDQMKIRQLIERSNLSGSTLLTSTTPQLPTPRENNHTTTTTTNQKNNLNNRSSRSNNSSKSNHSKDSTNEQKKMMRLKGITFKEFQGTLAKLHRICQGDLSMDGDRSFKIFYTDKKTGTLLPINNDDNLAKAISSCQPTTSFNTDPNSFPNDINTNSYTYSGSNSVLKIYIFNSNQQHSTLLMSKDIKGNTISTPAFENTNLPEELISPLMVTKRKIGGGKGSAAISSLSIGSPVNFRPVSAIIDVDVLPESLRRVRLHKHKSDRPLGFFIRDGSSLKMGSTGLEKVPAIFISRLVKDGLASMTGLLSVNDEVLEVNGIDVSGKTLDQVTHMMIANSENLIITVKPANQKNNPVRSKSISNKVQSQQQTNTSFQHTSFHSNHSTNKIQPPHSSPFSQNSHNKNITRTPIAEPIRSAFILGEPPEEEGDEEEMRDINTGTGSGQPYVSI